MKVLRNYDEADALIRARTPFRSIVRVFDRYLDFNPGIYFSGTTACRVMSEWLGKYPEGDCVETASSTRQRPVPWYEQRDRTHAVDCTMLHAARPIARLCDCGAIERATAEVSDFCHTFGNLPPEYHDSVRSATYVVRSYETPIAWHVNTCDWSDPADVARWLADEHPGLWIIPEVRYSMISNNHQGQVRGALEGTWRNNHPALPVDLVRWGELNRVPSGRR